MAWVPSTPTVGSIILASDTGIYYTNLGAGPGLLFPNPVLTQVLGAFWAVTTDSPQTEQTRTIQLQGLGPNGWYNMSAPYTEGFPYPTINLTGLPFTAVRFLYTLANGCQYYSGNGTFIPPVVPPADCTITPDFSVAQAVDANMEGLTGDGYFFIATDQYAMGNAWASNVGSVVNVVSGVYTYTVVAEGQVVYAIDTQLYWRVIGGDPAPLFPTLTATLTASPSGYFLESDWINASLSGTRMIIVEAEILGVWTIVYMGYEYDLPQQLPELGPFEGLRATYLLNGCGYEIAGTVVNPDTLAVDFNCSSELSYLFYRYNSQPDPGNTSWLFTNTEGFGETITLAFIAGEIAADAVVFFYDGPDSGSPSIVAFSGMDMAGQVIISTGSTLFMQITQADTAMAADLDTWWWQVGCTSGYGLPVATVAVTEKCDSYEIGLTVTIGSFSGASAAISYTVDGGAPTVITGLAPGIYPLGSFPYNSVVVVTVIDEDDPVLASIILGSYTGSGDCDDPCLPSGLFKLDGGGDLADLPPVGPFTVYTFFVATDDTNLGTWPIGTVLGWGTLVPGQYDPIPYGPGLFGFGSPLQIWQGLGPSPPNLLPYPIYPQMFLTPTGNSPNNWSLACPSVVEFAIPLNTPFQLQVRNGMGPWQAVGDFTLQQLSVPVSLSIVQPFTTARTMWNEATCGLSRPVFLGT